ncbi:MAG: ROK family protein [Rikenellaceae bacterium]|jgi:glucokinase|nr:ROK family protein [Rikenellaceae bacterium]
MEKLAIGIDIGGTNSKFGLVTADGRVVAQGSLPTQHYPDFDRYVEELSVAIRQLVEKAAPGAPIEGVGVGAPNASFFNGTIENAANLPWKGIVPFIEKLSPYFPECPMFVTNDAKAATIGEMVYGNARGMSDFIVITLGTGLGSGFVVGGKLVLGHRSFAGELGHTIINPGGRVCGCGRHGCLETYVSATGICRTVFNLLADHTEASEFRGIPFNDLTSEKITQAALAGDPFAIEAYEYTGKILGESLANAVTVTDPEAVFLFGGLAKAGKYIFEPTGRHLNANLHPNYKNRVKLLPSGIDGMNAAILGASASIWHNAH